MTENAIEKELAGHDFFLGLEPSFITFLADCAKTREVGADTHLFRHGSRADRFYLLRKGCVCVEVAAISGPPLRLQRLRPGDMLGWSWLIAPFRWHFQARALEDSEVIEFDGDAVLKRCEADPKFGYELLKRFSGLMSSRLAASREKMMDEWHPPGFA